MKRRPTKAKTPAENAILSREIKRLRLCDHPLTRSAACRQIEAEHSIHISHTKARNIEKMLQEPASLPQPTPTRPQLHIFGMLNPNPPVNTAWCKHA